MLVTDTSTWDDKLLAETLLDLSLQELDFTLEATGFDMGETDLRVEGLDIELGGLGAIACSAAMRSRRRATRL